MRAAGLLLALAACDGSESALPDGGVSGVFLESDTGFLVPFSTTVPMRISVGGTQRINLVGKSPPLPYTAPYLATGENGDAFRVEDAGSAVVTLRGASTGSARLRVRDPANVELGTAIYGTADIAYVSLELWVTTWSGEKLPPDALSPLTRSLAWAPGEHTFGIGLHAADPELQLIDGSMTVSLVGADRPYFNVVHVANAAVGNYPITVVAGGVLRTLDFVVTDQADSLTQFSGPSALVADQDSTFCFQTRVGGRLLLGLPWSFTVTGAVSSLYRSPLISNCISITTHVPGQIMLTAAAGGMTSSLSL
ncbi:MAG: hypothetical protein IPQ07_30625 [Myxococcales bacterium]|nr:hypothetical protein [Myxococcales bacterium]